MTDMRTWPHEFITEFIGLYRSFPCLYDVKCKQYSNKQLKAAAYTKLVEKMREVDCFATRDDVIKKINNMRSSYRKEAKKIEVGRLSGEPYEPTLWYFHMLDFLYDNDASKDSRTDGTTDDESHLEKEDEEEEDEEKGSMSVTSPQRTETPDTIIHPSVSSIPILLDRNYSPILTKGLTRKRTCERDKDLFPSMEDRFNKRRSLSYSSYGAYIAEELSNLQPAMATFCQKIINDAIYEAKCGYLNRTSRIISDPEQIPPSQHWTVEMKAQRFNWSAQ